MLETALSSHLYQRTLQSICRERYTSGRVSKKDRGDFSRRDAATDVENR
jgi:hypothetical protein